MMCDSNVFILNHQELVSFLQKTGQYDALRIVRKFEIGGDKLSELCNECKDIEVTDKEKAILRGFINQTKLNLGITSVPSALKVNSIEDDGQALYQNVCQTSQCLDVKRFEQINEAGEFVELTKVEYTNCQQSNTYVESLNHKYNHSMVEYKNFKRPSVVSDDDDDYITPLPPMLSRFEEVTTTRLKKTIVDSKKVNVNIKNSYIEVIEPDLKISNQNQNISPTTSDYMCGFACFMKCINCKMQKKEH